MDLSQLDKTLQDQAYLDSNDAPGKKDADAFFGLKGRAPLMSKHPNVYRWYSTLI